MEEQRRRRLHTLFTDTLKGLKGKPTLFLEALRSEEDAVDCISRLLGSVHGITALRTSLIADKSASFINDHVHPVLQYFQSEEVASAFGGLSLRELICKLVEPPIFWQNFVAALETNLLSAESLDSFAWLLLQLVSLPDDLSTPFLEVAQRPAVEKSLGEHLNPDTRNVYHKIKTVISTTSLYISDATSRPGGRHDNDFEDFRHISILPTVDELASREEPFLRFASEVEEQPKGQRFSTLLDNQFRLLRHDMVHDLRDELIEGPKSGQIKRRALRIDNVILSGIECDERCGWLLKLQCVSGIPMINKWSQKKRKQYVQEHSRFLGNDSLCCILANHRPVALGSVRRREDELSKDFPQIFLKIPAAETIIKRLYTDLRRERKLQLVQMATAVFSHEPILRQLQQIRLLPLAESFVTWSQGDIVPERIGLEYSNVTHLIDNLRTNPSCDLQHLLDLQDSVKLDINQAKSLISGLTQQVCLIQGPPGTGKSFIGALIAKAIMTSTDDKILVLSYTNHALDQYLEDLLDIGIDEEDMVRLGYSEKASYRTRGLSIRDNHFQRRLTRAAWELLNKTLTGAKEAGKKLHSAYDHYFALHATRNEIMQYLEFSDEYRMFFDNFQLPIAKDGYNIMGKNGKRYNRFSLLDRWSHNLDSGLPTQLLGQQNADVWSLRQDERIRLLTKWQDDMLAERLECLVRHGKNFNELIDRAQALFGEKDRHYMSTKRVIGCTTSVAARNITSIQSISPEIIIVEEAGEILESHILAAIGPQTKQLILIGDHKQLRPKAHYSLSIEIGTGYDLNRSLFERLVLKGYPHNTLSVQRRMRPEISEFVRSLTYPELIDFEEVKQRPPLRGFQSNMAFINHSSFEKEVGDRHDSREGISTSSRNNEFEAQMTLKCVRYLAQQGYRSDQVVVLTPYLGQLRHLLDVLKHDNDPVLADMDSYDLVRAGLMPAATAAIGKRKLRISTIDNYQGEESDVVVVSLTRSNNSHDIGFMSSPERLNVLLSRARLGLIIIGNASTFMGPRKGREIWNQFFDLLKKRSLIYDGVPIKCEQHPDRVRCLQQPEDFDKSCPDGGCDMPCGSNLKCGHRCPQKCHQISDHSQMPCQERIFDACSSGHPLQWKCSDGKPSTCAVCLNEQAKRKAKQQADFDRKQQEVSEKQDHENELALRDEAIEKEQHEHRQKRLKQDRKIALEQKDQDLENVRQRPSTKQSVTIDHLASSNKILDGENSLLTSQDNSASTSQKGTPRPVTQKSETFETWQKLKTVQGHQNAAMDELLKLTGLETVKERFLSIFNKFETAKRQDVDLASERMGTILLGNPGTGKTTVARHFVKFLSLLGVLPGIKFVESTGARLAHEGVDGAKKALDSILEAGGGAFFIDEAYQLVSGHNQGGNAVLDFLLAEIENTTGQVVFILAGYHKQMEKFFQHNQGLESRFPHRLHFEDYSEAELRLMLERKIQERYHHRMKVEGGLQGLYIRITVRRLHRGSGKEGFGNARALENLFQIFQSRQAKRISRERERGHQPDDFLLTKEDIIGPEPSNAIVHSLSWKKLQEMIGLDSVKQNLQGLVDRLQYNYQRELKEKALIEVSLNKLFIGSPGTGKTTVAKLYGQILCDIGLLSTSEYVVKTPADFIGSFLGESEKNTKAILESSKGKVLVIDEAYMLCSSLGDGGSSASSDIYRTAVIDTIVSEVHSTPGEDRAVLLLGYQDQMAEMLRKVNPGLARRFPLDSAFMFEDYNDAELLAILNLKLKQQDLKASDEAKSVAIASLARLRRRTNFGNAGEVENLLSRAKDSFQKRQSAMPLSEKSDDAHFEPVDFDNNFERSKNASDACQSLFNDIVGREDVIEKLKGYVEINQQISMMEDMAPEDQLPFNFVFRGPPGTGKTTTARLIGRVFYNMGFLDTSEVLDCSATDLVGQFVGHTGPKVLKKLDEALGKVLLIDEAYRLGEGTFAREAIDELVDALTKPKYKCKLLVILAGYNDEINSLLHQNPGLQSRFSEKMDFKNLTPRECLELLNQHLSKKSFTKVCFSDIDDEATEICKSFQQLSEIPGWGNGRDIENIYKNITGHILKSQRQKLDGRFPVYASDVLQQLQKLYAERKSSVVSPILGTAVRSPTSPPLNAPEIHALGPRTRLSGVAVKRSDVDSMSVDTELIETNDDDEVLHPDGQPAAVIELSCLPDPDQPDPGVSLAEFQALLAAKDEADAHESNCQKVLDSAKMQAQLSMDDIKSVEHKLDSTQSEEAGNDDARRLHEALRLEAVKLKRQRDGELARIRKLEEEARVRKAQESRAQKKLRDMGVCPVGFRWIKRDGGYQCAGGSHFVSIAQLGI